MKFISDKAVNICLLFVVLFNSNSNLINLTKSLVKVSDMKKVVWKANTERERSDFLLNVHLKMRFKNSS